jgi:OmpA-OmpF porin, OOP family
MSKNLIFFFSFLFFSTIALAQNFEIGLTLGTNAYNGDVNINASNLSSALKLGIGVVGKYRLNNHFLLRGQVITGALSGSEKNSSEAWRQERGLAFQTKMTELAGLLEWELMQKKRTHLYAFGGIGATFFNPVVNYNEPNPFILTDINADAKTPYRKTTVAIPLGLGIKYHLNNNFNLSFEIGARKVFTDYLDGISKIANPNKNDMYLFSGFTLTKAFGGGKASSNRMFQNGEGNCPKF